MLNLKRAVEWMFTVVEYAPGVSHPLQILGQSLISNHSSFLLGNTQGKTVPQLRMSSGLYRSLKIWVLGFVHPYYSSGLVHPSPVLP